MTKKVHFFHSIQNFETHLYSKVSFLTISEFLPNFYFKYLLTSPSPQNTHTEQQFQNNSHVYYDTNAGSR